MHGFSTAHASPGVLTGFHGKDPSTNLNGAVIEAIRVLQKQLDSSPVPLRFWHAGGVHRRHRSRGAR